MLLFEQSFKVSLNFSIYQQYQKTLFTTWSTNQTASPTLVYPCRIRHCQCIVSHHCAFKERLGLSHNCSHDLTETIPTELKRIITHQSFYQEQLRPISSQKSLKRTLRSCDY